MNTSTALLVDHPTKNILVYYVNGSFYNAETLQKINVNLPLQLFDLVQHVNRIPDYSMLIFIKTTTGWIIYRVLGDNFMFIDNCCGQYVMEEPINNVKLIKIPDFSKIQSGIEYSYLPEKQFIRPNSDILRRFFYLKQNELPVIYFNEPSIVNQASSIRLPMTPAFLPEKNNISGWI